MYDYNFLAIIESDNIDLFLYYFNKYDKRHLRVKHKKKNLYTTLFSIEIEKIKNFTIDVSGITGDSLMKSFSLNEEYLLVFNTDENILGKITFIDFE